MRRTTNVSNIEGSHYPTPGCIHQPSHCISERRAICHQARLASRPWGRRPHGFSVPAQQQQRATTFRGAFSSMHGIVRRARARRAAGTPLTRRSCRLGFSWTWPRAAFRRTAGPNPCLFVGPHWHRGPLGAPNTSFWAQMHHVGLKSAPGKNTVFQPRIRHLSRRASGP